VTIEKLGEKERTRNEEMKALKILRSEQQSEAGKSESKVRAIHNFLTSLIFTFFFAYRLLSYLCKQSYLSFTYLYLIPLSL
jgi:hypothetical protein